MKRTLTKGILSASLVASRLVARTSAQVYSQNVGSFLLPETTNSTYWSSVSECHGIIMAPGDVRLSSTVWQKGPFTIRESRSWTNVAVLSDDIPPGHPVSSSTSLICCTYSITVPLTPRQIAVVGAVGLVVLGLIVFGLLLKSGSINSSPPTRQRI